MGILRSLSGLALGSGPTRWRSCCAIAASSPLAKPRTKVTILPFLATRKSARMVKSLCASPRALSCQQAALLPRAASISSASCSVSQALTQAVARCRSGPTRTA